MPSITLLKPNHTTQSIFRSQNAVRLTAITILAFIAGVATVTKPILLLAAPTLGIAYGISKLVIFIKEILSINFNTEGPELSYEEIIEELSM